MRPEFVKKGGAMGLAGKLFKGDRSIWIIFMFLCFISLVEVYSASSQLALQNKEPHYWGPIVKHGMILLLGFGAVLLLHNIPYRYYSAAIILLPISIILLIVTLVIGISKGEANRWLPLLGIQFQPSELAKLSCVVFVAFVLSRQERFTPKNAFIAILLGLIPTCGLILPENFSTAFLLFVVCFLMMFIGQVSYKRLGMLLLAVFAVAAVAVAVIKFTPEDFAKKYLPNRFVTWQGRIENFGEKDGGSKYVFNDATLQVSNAKIAIARGGVVGQMPGRSVQRDFLPEASSDFIYAIIIEEMGLVGGLFVLFLYVALMFRVAIIARRCEKLFPKYLLLGCGLLIVVQALINMSVAVNLIPVTGQPLPLISRGGTSTMLTCFYFGIILSVSRFGAGMDEADEETEEIEEAGSVDGQPDAGPVAANEKNDQSEAQDLAALAMQNNKGENEEI